MIVILVGLVLAFVLLTPLGAAAQTVTIEGGGAGFGVAARTSFGTVSDGVGGAYAGASVAIPGATWLQPYFAGNGLADLGDLWQAGVNLRLGPERWLRASGGARRRRIQRRRRSYRRPRRVCGTQRWRLVHRGLGIRRGNHVRSRPHRRLLQFLAPAQVPGVQGERRHALDTRPPRTTGYPRSSRHALSESNLCASLTLRWRVQ